MRLFYLRACSIKVQRCLRPEVGQVMKDSRRGPTFSLSGYLLGLSRMDLPFCPDFLESISLSTNTGASQEAAVG